MPVIPPSASSASAGRLTISPVTESTGASASTAVCTYLLPRSAEAMIAISVAMAAKVNARCRPLANGASIRCGKKDRPVM